jgi:hypothetical protein
MGNVEASLASVDSAAAVGEEPLFGSFAARAERYGQQHLTT